MTEKGLLPVDQNLDQDRTKRRRTRRRGIIALLTALAALTLGAGSVSLAFFTDSDSSTWSFTTGTISITSNPAVVTAVTGMMPGDSATDSLTIANTGNATLRYAMSTVATNALGGQLTLAVRAEDAGGGCAAFTGAVIVASGTTLNGAAIGSSAQGAQAGDRTLAGGASEVLCFRVSLPSNTGNAFQGVSSVATFTFDAEQTANNP
jgi:predicted ribosomally synthesized peptide with SipW-like signal peptide